MKKLLVLLLLPSIALAKSRDKPQAPALSPVRPFVGADLVWSLDGEPVLGPDSGAAIDAAVSQPAEVGAGCKVGDLAVKSRSVDVQLTCADGPHVASAMLGKGQPFSVELWAGAGEAFTPVREELLRRFNGRADAIPLSSSRLAQGDAAQVPAELAPWYAASTALLATDLANAATAVEAGVARGPAALGAVSANRLKAAAILVAVLRAQGKDWKLKVKPFVAPLLKAGDAPMLELGAAVLAGKAPRVVDIGERCFEHGEFCNVFPVIDALVAVGRAPEAAQILGAMVAESLARTQAPADGHFVPSIDFLRLTLGVAELAGNQPLYQKVALKLTQLEPNNNVGWENLVLAYLLAKDPRGALQTLLQVQVRLAATPTLLTQVSALVDALWDQGTPQALTAEQRADLVALADPPQTAARQLLRILADGWAGKTQDLEARLAALPQQPHVIAWRAGVAMAEHRLDDAHRLLDPLAGDALLEPQVLAAQLELVLQDPEGTEARIAELRAAWHKAEVRLGRLGVDARSQHWDVVVQVRTWGLQPPVRWPLTDRITR